MARHGLRRIGRLGAEFLGGVPGPARIPHGGARQADQIRLAGGDDVLGLLVAGDQADGHGGDAALALDLLGERHLVARRERNLLLRVEPAAGDVHIVAAELLELLRQHHGFLGRPAAIDPVGRRYADAERFLLGPRRAHRLVDFERKADAVFGRVAVFVGALVRDRRHELVQQIAVAAMQLDHVVADAVDALGRRGEFADAALDVVLGHGVRHRPAGVIRDGRRRLGRPAAFLFGQNRLAAGRRRRGRAFAPGMRQLHAELGDAVGAAEIVHALQRRLVVVGIHAGAFGRDPPDRIDVGHLAHHQPGAAEREAAEMHQVPVVRRAVGRIVLAHRRDHDPVGKREPAQRDRGKQDAGHAGSSFRFNP